MGSIPIGPTFIFPKGIKLNDQIVYVIVTEIIPQHRQQIQEVCSTETIAWETIEKSFYKHLNYLLKTDHKIDVIKFGWKTVLIAYHDKDRCYQTKYKIFKSKLCQ